MSLGCGTCPTFSQHPLHLVGIASSTSAGRRSLSRTVARGRPPASHRLRKSAGDRAHETQHGSHPDHPHGQPAAAGHAGRPAGGPGRGQAGRCRAHPGADRRGDGPYRAPPARLRHRCRQRRRDAALDLLRLHHRAHVGLRRPVEAPADPRHAALSQVVAELPGARRAPAQRLRLSGRDRPGALREPGRRQGRARRLRPRARAPDQALRRDLRHRRLARLRRLLAAEPALRQPRGLRLRARPRAQAGIRVHRRARPRAADRLARPRHRTRRLLPGRAAAEVHRRRWRCTSPR